jgi:hypothetical protein
MILNEIVNQSKLHKVLNCSNIPIKKPEDEYWCDNFKEMLKGYNGNVEYHRKSHGRYFGNGLQSCQRDVRKYLADNNYIDIDIENCHPVLLQNLFDKYSMKVPLFLSKYNNNKKEVISEYNLTDKLYIIKLINNSICYDTRPDIIEFHNGLYKELIPKLIQEYSNIKLVMVRIDMVVL